MPSVWDDMTLGQPLGIEQRRRDPEAASVFGAKTTVVRHGARTQGHLMAHAPDVATLDCLVGIAMRATCYPDPEENAGAVFHGIIGGAGHSQDGAASPISRPRDRQARNQHAA